MSDQASRPYIGGQAVIEGVMMRSPRSFAIVVRRRSGELCVRESPIAHSAVGVRAWPLVRGMFVLGESLSLGARALRFSGELYEADMEAEEAAKAAGLGADAGKDGVTAKPAPKPGVLSALALSMVALVSQSGTETPGAAKEAGGKSSLSVLSLVVALGIFIVAPQAAAAFANKTAHLDWDLRSPAFQALTGAFKLLIVVGYLLAIRRVPEIHRVFQFHGAEHKTISTYEAEEPLTVANARRKTTLHPRCGTTFLVMVALVSILVFSFIGALMPDLGGNRAVQFTVLLALKLPFLPVIAGITFEIQRFTARYCTTGPLRALLWPGFVVQKITTIEPDDAQLEVALAAMEVTLWRERAPEAAPPAQHDERFATFDALMASPGWARG